MKHLKGKVAAMALLSLAGTANAVVWEFNWFQNGTGGGAIYSAGTAPFYTALKITGPNEGAAGFRHVLFTAITDMELTIAGTYSSTDTGTFDSGYYAVNGSKTTFITNGTQGPFTKVFNVSAGDEVWIGVDSADGIAGPGIMDLTVVEPLMDRGFGAFLWRTADDGAFTASFLVPPPTLQVIGGDGGVAERAYIWSYLECPSTFSYNGTYSSNDTGAFDECFSYVYSGSQAFTTIATNATQGPINGSFFSGGGAPTYEGQFGMGVYSTDGQFGPGQLTVGSFNARQLTAWMGDVPWGLATNGTGGSGTISGATMTITGGNNGTPGDTQYTYYASQAMIVQAQVDYSSPDSDCYDSAFYVINGTKTTIACNDSPGAYNVQFEVEADDIFGFGVNTADGAFGAGTAVVRRVRAFPQHEEAGCYPDCDASGSLNIDDFICFQTLFAIADPSADCDGSGSLNIDDFICFQTFFAIGC